MIIDKEKDTKLIGGGVKILPFVGDDFEYGISFNENGHLQLGTEKKPGKKVLVLSESYYCNEELSEGKMHSYTRDVMNSYLLSEEHHNMLITFIKFERALANKITNSSDRNVIWNHLMFYTYSQTLCYELSSKNEDNEKISRIFLDVLNEYTPDYIIVWGYNLYYKFLPYIGGFQGEQLESDGSETWILQLGSKKVKILPIQHPSRGFAWDNWHYSIMEFLNK